jgi:uncharacterized ParB-like nuclease family protein
VTSARDQGGSAREPVRPIAVAQLDLSLVHRVRAAVCVEAVEDYAPNLDALPPVQVADVDGQLVLIGGLHRLRAAERDGRAEIAALVEPMDWVSAVRAAAGDNRRHGVRMTGADKRAAARLLLDECPDMSDRAVAELVGCSPPTVATVRQALPPPADRLPVPVDLGLQLDGQQVKNFYTSHGDPPLAGAAPRRGRDGKAYRVTARSGLRARQTPEESRAASPQPTGLDDAPKLSPALLVDYRSKAEWVAQYLRCVLHPAGREHRREALDSVLAGLTPEELRILEERIAAALGSTTAGPAA